MVFARRVFTAPSLGAFKNTINRCFPKGPVCTKSVLFEAFTQLLRLTIVGRTLNRNSLSTSKTVAKWGNHPGSKYCLLPGLTRRNGHETVWPFRRPHKRN